ncbi:MAG: hypothetical protein ACK4TB_17130 [Gemmobacter sp.]
MTGFVQTLAGGVVGAGAVLAAQFVPGVVAPAAPDPAEVAAPVAGGFGPGAILLAGAPDACPPAWPAGGAVTLLTDPDYVLVEGQGRANPGLLTTSTAGFANVRFTLCIHEAAP